jgi:hypothetical protein
MRAFPFLGEILKRSAWFYVPFFVPCRRHVDITTHTASEFCYHSDHPLLLLFAISNISSLDIDYMKINFAVCDLCLISIIAYQS